MTMKITRLQTTRRRPQGPISCYSTKFSKIPNQSEAVQKEKPRNYLRKQSLISPQRSLLAGKARRDPLGQEMDALESRLSEAQKNLALQITHWPTDREPALRGPSDTHRKPSCSRGRAGAGPTVSFANILQMFP